MESSGRPGLMLQVCAAEANQSLINKYQLSVSSQKEETPQEFLFWRNISIGMTKQLSMPRIVINK